ncbi:MAG TPA: branched-chain amino acid aminotransferase [Stellaceae bacterium]|nr:branched-chain amino acid aminotransferase [Stellaceae bacterium]
MDTTISWKELGFRYLDTGAYVRADFTGGAWSSPQLCAGTSLQLHIAATCLHYGQACFEGSKAFRQADGRIGCFRSDAHARRMIMSARRLAMTPPPESLFLEAVRMIVKGNEGFVPPFGTGATFYVRPLLIGTSAVIGVHPSDDYAFIVFGMPVGPYYKDGMVPVRAYVQEDYDRAAPHGVGHVKAAGNYAAGLVGDMEVKAKGYPVSLYLDSATHTLIDEFGTSNFIGITRDGAYVTPKSASILESVTNDSLRVIAGELGLRVEHRPIRWSELQDFVEIGACGTAAVITPICSITRGDTILRFGAEDKPGPTLQRLYDEIQAIQYGKVADRHHWMMPVV